MLPRKFFEVCHLHHCAETGLSYELKRSSRRRTLAIQINQHGLQVLAPLYLDQYTIQQFVVKKQLWIREHLAKRAPVPDHISRQRIPFLGQELILRQVRDSITAVTRDGDQLWVQISRRVREENLAATVRQRLERWLVEQAHSWFAGRIAFYSKAMQVAPQQLVIKGWQTKWGSCHANGTISLNWRLLLAPSWVGDYVVVHELAHLVHMNHSEKFWALVATYYPEHQQAKHWLKQHQTQLQLK
ncbi:MAG TPA: hypothetical protein DCS87_05800 [Rheinheimera sp.]|nr:hypothetical protein [Rheinheimera sp.]